ncbi:LysR family transcriptional regulator [Actinobacillus equuli subsp. equuli]|uniref:LysR family transcriptional regulator n=4 Tax=Actinobacillus TaxID=713 RepID=A0A0A7MHD3_ACTEU|nr:LysR family transcriptional regulator [Actinobacillus equuli]AIZ79984.1 LysR family transcriptional regulator [Actinobacillus equuli subsp. equuli]MDE8035140.1 LysR family transcriptional regulator [Actinobacillus equuli subsp. equuli]MDG4947147.1 LysR family transcriptional regulator [Actinobacillus equuli subsp. haemolyticus]MDG4953219.1 LysR family transcriptional regulator [Actinobacillus equuli subsp. equuli]WGE41946.1 LysR family transcriptional regulator [Actinobacillus equuli subsp.
MLNKLDALKYFCTAAQTLNFREAANQLAISPPVITRVINALENELGEQLFKRTTRNIALTDFGEEFLLHAKQLLTESERVFNLGKKQQDEMAGTVRITLPKLRDQEQILFELLQALKPYPDLIIDWRVDAARLDNVKHRIDIGIRASKEPNPNFIVRPLAEMHDIFVASPDFIARWGVPKDLDDLRKNFPFSSLINATTGQPWEIYIDENTVLVPQKLGFITTDLYSELQAALAGRTIAHIGNTICKPYIENGQLVQIFPEQQFEKWQLYLYRPYQQITSPRVLKVFDILTEIMQRRYGE